MIKGIRLLGVVWIACTASPTFCQTQLERAKQMLEDLQRQRSEAANTGQEARFTPAYIDARLLEIEGSVNSGILSLLNGTRSVGAPELERELRDLQERDDTVGAFSCATKGRTLYIVGYALIGAITTSRSWVGVFGSEQEGKSYELLAAADNSLPDKTFALQRLNCAADSGTTFLAYGVNWGDAHSRLTVIGYSFPGHQLQPIWSRRDLPEGSLKVERGEIVLRFMSSLTPPWMERKEVYQLTSKGIALRRKASVARTCSPRSAVFRHLRAAKPRTYKTGPRYACFGEHSNARGLDDLAPAVILVSDTSCRGARI